MWLGLERPNCELGRHLNTLSPPPSVLEDWISFLFRPLCSRGNGINHCVMFLSVTHRVGDVFWLRNATCLRFLSAFFQDH